MTLSDIYQQFSICKSWQESYRLLIQLSKQLAKPTEAELAELPEIEGCESRLWFQFQAEPRYIAAYSDARLMQGLLVIVKVALLELPQSALAHCDLQAIFNQLHITPHLTHTRLNGLKQIQHLVRLSASDEQRFI